MHSSERIVARICTANPRTQRHHKNPPVKLCTKDYFHEKLSKKPVKSRLFHGSGKSAERKNPKNAPLSTRDQNVCLGSGTGGSPGTEWQSV